jgi:prepilin-type N-terminal cleavage/methylation domain-containing protein
MKQNNKSFTIIELLVVIAIIGVLASIVLVSLSSTRDRAQITKTLLYSSQIYHSLGADIAGNWNFDEGSGTTALDSSGYNNTGTIMNGAFYTSDTPHKAAGQGAGKYALSFDGTNDYVDCGNGTSLNITGPLTISAWAKASSFSGRTIVGKKYPAADTEVWELEVGGTNQFYFAGSNDGVTYHISVGSGTGKSTGAWYHLVGVYDGSTAKLYVNGALENTDNTVESSLTSTTGNVYVGRGYGSGYYGGLVDEIQIYSRALTALEIQKLYAEGSEKHKDLAIK